jgi:hypothetical protein
MKYTDIRCRMICWLRLTIFLFFFETYMAAAAPAIATALRSILFPLILIIQKQTTGKQNATKD